ncbi:MAG: hypothetical protein FMNOHCHN_01808 [Ignavibacteriaceae bacterium]|nr:hypothetical protein [Ignavibacteriaceae bacterium]
MPAAGIAACTPPPVKQLGENTESGYRILIGNLPLLNRLPVQPFYFLLPGVLFLLLIAVVLIHILRKNN